MGSLSMAEFRFQEQCFQAGDDVWCSCNRTYGRHSNSLDVNKKVCCTLYRRFNVDMLLFCLHRAVCCGSAKDQKWRCTNPLLCVVLLQTCGHSTRSDFRNRSFHSVRIGAHSSQVATHHAANCSSSDGRGGDGV